MRLLSTLPCLLIALASFSGLRSQTWIRQNPFPTLASLLDVHFDGPYGLAVGEEGLLFTTTNGGVSWVPRTIPTPGQALSAAMVVPGTKGQLMLTGGYQLLISRNGGQTWEISDALTASIYKFQQLPDGTLLVLNRLNALKSTDQGLSWRPITMPDEDVAAGHFVDTLQGWVQSGGFNNNQVWVTTDGGMDWQLRDTLRHPVVSAIEMIDADTGFLAARDYVYKTTDGGHHWTPLHANAVNSLMDMHVVDGLTIWTCLINGFIWRSLDGGDTWDEIDPRILSSNRTSGIFADAGGRVWAAGKFVSLLHTDDGGLTWGDQIPGVKDIMYRPHFADATHGLVGAANGNILKTVDGGASWQRLYTGPDEYHFAVHMTDPDTLWAGSSSGRVFLSRNGGALWNEVGFGFGQVSDLHAFGGREAVAITETGQIYRTENAGLQWDLAYSGTPDILLGLDFPDQENGWACGWFGQILHTSDGGANWTSQHSGGPHQFAAVDFVNDQEGWVIASSFTDTVFHTTDGGATWVKRVIPYKTFWHAVSFHSPDTGWIAGGSAGSGIIIRTDDGGETWSAVHFSPEALFGLHAVPGAETAWATGIGGNIIKYSPCTFNPTILSLEGDPEPCQRDTVGYTAGFTGVDEFLWTFPADWLVFGNSNTSSIRVIVGAEAGIVSVRGRDGCANESAEWPLAVNPIPTPEPQIIVSGAYLTCSLDGVAYQWLLNGAPIDGQTSQTHAPGTDGEYRVLVTLPMTGCSVLSSPVDFTVTQTVAPAGPILRFGPNPASTEIRIIGGMSANPSGEIRYVLFDSVGRIVRSGSVTEGSIPLGDLPAGMYGIRVRVGPDVWVEKLQVMR
jgi:photosystem II stability/assembly factor-like uncharacterized protein